MWECLLESSELEFGSRLEWRQREEQSHTQVTFGILEAVRGKEGAKERANLSLGAWKEGDIPNKSFLGGERRGGVFGGKASLGSRPSPSLEVLSWMTVVTVANSGIEPVSLTPGPAPGSECDLWLSPLRTSALTPPLRRV